MSDQQPAVPRYQQIAEELRAAIASGEYPPGSRIPGENALMQLYGVARNTARQALAVLKDAGLTEARKGSGVYVRVDRLIRRNAVKRLAAQQWGGGKSIWEADLSDQVPVATDLAVEEVDVPKELAAVMELSLESRVWRRSRTYEVDGRPVNRAVSYLPAELVAGTAIVQPDTGPGGTYARLAEIGHAPAHFREEVRVRMPLPEEARLLDLPAATPVILIVRVARDAEGRVVEVNHMTMDATRYVLEYDFSS
ncbi:GntR family transcriptional regulator [Kitasatospora sp. NPDC085879]|uniref:GntR family transcriptional regulator n=1 Tax=Kitasatospora sp. NPDC085879 TaxID=3154769 RepID=UPI003426AABD